MNSSSQEGLPLLETLLAFALLANMLLGMSSLFLKLLAGSEKGGDLQAGFFLAQKMVAEETRFASVPSRDVATLYSHDGTTPLQFTYQVTSTLVQPSPRLYYVDVEVWWMGGQRSNQGQLHVRLGKLRAP